MSDIDILHQMIKDTAKIPVCDEYNRKRVIIEERQQPTSPVTIRGLPDDVIVIRADAFRSPDTVFRGTKGECKRADFVIVADTGRKRVIICIEMKATQGATRDIIQQLTGAKCFVLYCREIGREFWKQREFLKDYVYRFVSIAHISIDKRGTRMTRQQGSHDHPDRMLKIDWPQYLEFNRLA